MILAILALCIAVNISVFSLVDMVLLRPLPFPDPGTLVEVTARDRVQSSLPGCLSYDHFAFWRSHATAFDGLAGYTNESFNLTGRDVPVNVQAARVSSNFFKVLGVHTALGHGFDPVENEFSDAPGVLISHHLWQSQFGGRTNVVGSTIRLNARPMMILGILPPSFAFQPLGLHTEIWTTSLTQVSSITREQVQAGSCYINAVARLKTGKTLSQAKANALLLQGQFVRSYPKLGDADARREPEIRPLREQITGGSKPLLLLLSLAVAVLLLIACANVSGLFLTRAAERQKSIAVMTALGATRLRVAGQLVQETALISALAGCAGIALSVCVTRIAYASLASFLPSYWPDAPTIDGRIACFALGLSILTALFCAVLPAWQLARPDVGDSLRDDRRASSGRGARIKRNSLVVSQTALSISLLIVAGSLGDSFLRLVSQPVGFESRGVLAATVALPPAKYFRRDQIVGFYQRTLARIGALPGVQATAIASALPANESMLAHILAEGQPVLPVAQRKVAAIQSLTGSYLRVMQIPLLRGRFFDKGDRQGARAVAVINRTLAESYFRGGDPIGKRIWLGADPQPWQIVGVIGDVKNADLAGPPKPEVDFAFEQLPWPQMNILARSSNTMTLADDLKAEVAKEDEEQPLTDMQTLETLLGELRAQPRLITGTVALFAGASFLLALLGLCSAISYSSAQRSHEFGIRLALGATRLHLVRSVIGESVRLAGAGTLLGLFFALLLVRSMRATIYGEGEMHFVAFAATPVMFILCSVLASLVPALWFTRFHPAEILRRS